MENQNYNNIGYGGYQNPSYKSPYLLESPNKPLTHPGISTMPEGYQPSGASSAMSTTGDAAMMTANPVGMGVGAALKVGSAGLDVYGKYQEREDAKNRYDDAMAAWREERRIETEDRNREAMRQERQEGYFGADYSQNLEDRFAGGYGGYRQGGQ